MDPLQYTIAGIFPTTPGIQAKRHLKQCRTRYGGLPKLSIKPGAQRCCETALQEVAQSDINTVFHALIPRLTCSRIWNLKGCGKRCSRPTRWMKVSCSLLMSCSTPSHLNQGGTAEHAEQAVKDQKCAAQSHITQWDLLPVIRAQFCNFPAPDMLPLGWLPSYLLKYLRAVFPPQWKGSSRHGKKNQVHKKINK